MEVVVAQGVKKIYGINKENQVVAVLDIDSKDLATFDEVDKEWLEKIVTLL